MTLSNSTIERPFTGPRKLLVVIFIALSGAVTIGAIATKEPFLAIGGLLGILLLLALLKWPDLTTLLVVFYIYTNVGPVVMRFHNVPSYIAMGFPVILAIPLMWYLLVRRENLVITPVFQLLLLLFVIYTLGAVFSSDITLAVRKLIDFFFEGVLLYFLLTNVIRSPLMLKRVVWALLISGAFIGGLALYQQVTQTFDNEYGGFAQVQSDFGTGVETLQGEVQQSRLAGSIGAAYLIAVLNTVWPEAGFGGEGAAAGRFSLPAGICIDDRDRILGMKHGRQLSEGALRPHHLFPAAPPHSMLRADPDSAVGRGRIDEQHVDSAGRARAQMTHRHARIGEPERLQRFDGPRAQVVPMERNDGFCLLIVAVSHCIHRQSMDLRSAHCRLRQRGPVGANHRHEHGGHLVGRSP